MQITPACMRALPAALFSAFLIVSANPARAGAGVWTSSGPEGGRVWGLAASPDTADTFWALSRGGVFKTVDGGATWTEASAGINRQLTGPIVHSPTAAGRLHAFGTGKAFFSDDGAASWSDRTPPTALLTDSIVTAGLSPTVAGRVYVGLADGNLIRTDDAGLTWTTVTGIPQSGAFSITAIAPHPGTAGEVLVATRDASGGSDHRLWRGTGSGSAWSEVTCPTDCPWQDGAFGDLEFGGSGGTLWGVTFAGGAARSDDFGANWTNAGALGSGSAQDLAVHPTDPQQVYLAGRTGLAFTTDNGATWTEVLAGFSGNEAMQPADSTFVVYDPFDPAIQLAGSISNGVYRRTSTTTDTFGPGTDGFNAANIRAVDTAPGDRVHAGIGDSFGATFASFRSVDDAASWNPANSGLEADQFRDVTVDPNDIDVVYAGGRFDPKRNNSGTFDSGNGGIYKSTDGGMTWNTIDNGIPLSGSLDRSLFGTVRAVTVDEFSASGAASQTLYAGGTGRFSSDGSGGFTKDAARIFKSIDEGANWTAMDNGLGGAETGDNGLPLFASVAQIVQDPTDTSGNTLYAATFIAFLSESDVPTTIDNGVFKTIDGGANWTHTSNGLPHIDEDPAATNESMLALAIDPTDPTGQTLYASTNDTAGTQIGLGTVYKTTDGGANWAFSGVGLEGRDVRDLAVDPVTGEVYAAVADPLSNGDGGVFVSSDDGASWNSMSTGFPASATATKLALDNTGSNLLIHAGTTRGVQTFEVLPDDDIDGATDDTEASAPNAGDGNNDGTDDATQADVASQQISSDTQSGARFIQAVEAVEPEQSILTAEVAPVSGTCTRIESSFGLDELAAIPGEKTWELPFNGLHLRIPDCEQAEVTIHYHGSNFGDVTFHVRGYGLDFPDADTATWHRLPSSVDGPAWRFEVSDGGIGDATPEDGVIVFQGGAKRLAEVFFRDGMEAE